MDTWELSGRCKTLSSYVTIMNQIEITNIGLLWVLSNKATSHTHKWYLMLLVKKNFQPLIYMRVYKTKEHVVTIFI